MTRQKKTSATNWESVSLRSTPTGFIARERRERFKLESVTEVFLRATGILMIFAALLLWLLLPSGSGTEVHAMSVLFSSLLVAVGLGVFVFGSRGFRRQIALNLDKGLVSVTKINVHGQSRIHRDYDLTQVDSAFVQRPGKPGGLATLQLRLRSHPTPVDALTGNWDDVEEVHRQFCKVLKISSNSTDPNHVRAHRVKPSVKTRRAA